MKREALRGAEKYTKARQRKKRWYRVVTGLACVVVFCTVYALILPAITMEQTAYCGYEEHQHDESCYAQVLACGYDEAEGMEEPTVAGHTHGEGCYQQEQVLICDLEESPGHIHDDSCVQSSEELICSQEEASAHTHEESCVQTEQHLICTEESEEHEHTDACYETIETYICGLEEGEGGHTHSPECYGLVEVYICGMTAGEGGHTHDAACYETRSTLICALAEGEQIQAAPEEVHMHSEDCYEDVLICEMEEHQHETICFSNPEADVETAAVWGRSISGVTLTGVWADDVIAIAKSQLGYTESTQNYTVTEDGEINGITRYGQWYGDPYGDWCAMFVSFCLNYAQIPQSAVPYEASCSRWVQTLSGSLYRSAADYTPQKGDILFFDRNGDGSADHVGLVAAGSGTSLQVIEGNSANCVRTVTYSLDNDSILGYAALPENPSYAAAETAVENTEEAELLLAEESGIMLMAELPEESEYIDGGSIEGTEITWTLTKNEAGEYTLTFEGEGAIPDYTESSTDRPWRNYYTTSMRLVLGEGITRIGNYTFKNMRFTGVEWGGVASIGKQAFGYGLGLSSVTIPGSIKKIDDEAFVYHNSLVNVILEEGVETVGSNAFGFQIGTTSTVEVHIPASVTSIGAKAFWEASYYTVSEDNPNFCAIDGVLYSKDKTVLVDYPPRMIADEYRVPEHVTTIGTSALQQVSNTKKVYIPKTVKSFASQVFRNSNFEEIYFEDGTSLPSGMDLWFYRASNLVALHLPENTSYAINDIFYTGTFPNLTSFTIPNGVTAISSFGLAAVGPLVLPNLEKVIYDAENATIKDKTIMGSDTTFDLFIGPSVDNLSPNFSYFASHANAVYFEPNNTFTAEAGAFSGAQSPLADISGTFYVDSQGLLYAYDKTTQTASLIYCPPGVSAATIPGSITPEPGISCTVNGVRKDALKLAENLTAITFENPESITSLESHAMANCPTLTSVNGMTTVEEATALFTSAEIGYGVFYNTGLGGAGGTGSLEADMDGGENQTISREGATDLSILVSSGGETMEWIPNGDAETGGYKLLTGDIMTITASVGNTEGSGNNVYRVYLQLTNENGSLNIVPGQTYTFNGQTATCYATEDPYTVYLEFQPENGATVSIPITAVYPSPDSAGGGLTVWGLILTNEEAAAYSGKLVESSSGSIQAYWTTRPDEFRLTKTGTSTAALTILGDGNGGAKPNTTLNWQIKLERQTETTSAYGKDYAKSAEFTDVLTLPEGMSWNETIKSAIQGGKVRKIGQYLYAGDAYFATISFSGGSLSLTNVQVTWNEEQDTAVIHWRLTNTVPSAEMNAVTVNLVFYPDAFFVDMKNFEPTEKRTITNTVTATVHYHYSEDKELSDSAEKTISGGTGNIKLTKTGTDATYFGEDITYTLDVYNDGGLPWTADTPGAYTLRDELSQYSYISPENMEKMFNEEYGDVLTVTIQNAVLAPWQAVTGTEGSDSYQTSGNSDLGTAGNALTVAKTEGGFTAAVTEGNAYTGSSVAEALQNAGYSVTDTAKYTCVWTLNKANAVDAEGEPVNFTLESGEHRIFMVYASAKDTFQMLSTDWPNEYPSNSSVRITNQAFVKTPTNANATSGKSVSDDVKREAYIAKSVYQDGVYLGKAPKASDGDVLEYHLDFTHYGSGSYDDLPMVDDLYGSQYLLVPASLNPGLNKLETYEEDGVQYYKLEEGTYTNVVVGVDDEGNDLTAASITVTTAESETETTVGGSSFTYTGLHTEIKWYFPHLDGGNYRITVTYKALVDLSITGVNYTIGNVVWMNGRTDARIYDSLWGGGSIIQFDKDIVTEKGATFLQDILDEDDYCMVEPGQEVTYRLTLHNTATGNFHLNGKNLADVLPDTLGIFNWEKNVNLTDFFYEIDGNVNVTNLNDWYLGDGYAGLIGDRQYILWPETTEITFTEQSTIYLYFTLTYPEDNDTDDTWSQYAAALGGGTLDNTLYVYRYPSVVTHNLREKGEVLLQKGVYGMYWSATNSTSSANSPAGSSRLFYNNRDLQYRRIAYYVTLYNGGNKRLYLNDLYDRLPQGFTYISLFSQWPANNSLSWVNVITTCGGTSSAQTIPAELGADAVYRSAKITATKTDGGVTFSIGAGSGSYALKYDEEQKQYYLDRGEAIVFGYLCDIGLSTETEDSATNTVAMAYTDHLDTGLQVIRKNEVPATAPDSEAFTDYNDGTRLIKTGQQVRQDYGFGDGSNPEWLVSDVTVTRGGIIPGVTKYTESFTNSGGVTVVYTNSVGPNDTVNWRVRLHNSGTLSITDWTFTDIMPAPYVFEGAVTYQICDSTGSVWQTRTLMTFPGNRTGKETELEITYESSTSTVTFNGPWVSLEEDGSMQIALSRDENGNEVLQLRIGKPTMSIPEGGYVDISFSSRNPTNDYVNTVYTNQAMLTPNVQEFTTVQQGSMVRDENGKPVSAKNSSPVTVSFGYATSSEKRVTETENMANTAVSTDPDNNTIVLPDESSDFFYTLTVSNDTDTAMTKLVIIDNLPQVDDHSPFNTEALRGSEFRVSLAENPRFQITVTPESGEAYILDSEYYGIQYSTTTDFGGPQSNDWNGENSNTTATWTDNPTGARAFRIVITDADGTQIPAKAKISVAFHAKVDGDAQPGQIAWNSFGYHYALQGIDTELEAMPLVAGVKIPSVPSLQKRLVDSGGQSVEAPADAEFSFLIYEGAALEDSYDTEESLKNALESAGRKWKQVELPVQAGQTVSEAVYLDWTDWTWTEGQAYTVVELPTGEIYAFKAFSGSGGTVRTFTYVPAVSQAIVCENTLLHWAVSLTKQDNEGFLLPGAVFALYSPEEGDRLQEIPEEYGSLTPEQTLEQNGQTWYLAGIGTTGEKGTLSWNKLLRENYYLLEVKAPDGYDLGNPAGRILYRSGARDGVYAVTVINYAGYELPQTGGSGTVPYTIGGFLLLTSAAFLLLYNHTKRRKEDSASS